MDHKRAKYQFLVEELKYKYTGLRLFNLSISSLFELQVFYYSK